MRDLTLKDFAMHTYFHLILVPSFPQNSLQICPNYSGKHDYEYTYVWVYVTLK